MKKLIVWFGGTLFVLAAGVAVYIWYTTQQPLYKPGLMQANSDLSASLVLPKQSADDHFWTVEPGIRLHHFSYGIGRNVLILHGGPGMPYSEPWPGLESLADRFQFHYYDQRGAGESTRPIDRFVSTNYFQNVKDLDQALGLGAQLADIERIRRLLREEKLILIGHSFGAFLATLYAAEFPDQVEALVLVSPADLLVMPSDSGGLFELVRDRLPADKVPEYDAYIADYLDFSDIFANTDADLAGANQAFGQYFGAVMDTPLQVQGRPGGWMVQAMYFSMGRRHDYRAALSRVTAPVLVLRAAADIQPASVEQMYVEALPDARLIVIEDAGHFMFMDQPEAFGTAVETFLARLP